MIDCMVIGDSIAVGTHSLRPECVAHAKGGISSLGWTRTYGHVDLTATTVIISLGTNDWEKAPTFGTLQELRRKIKAKQVFWIAPHKGSKPHAYHQVAQVADMFGDRLIQTDRYQADKIHPNLDGYKELVAKTKEKP